MPGDSREDFEAAIQELSQEGGDRSGAPASSPAASPAPAEGRPFDEDPIKGSSKDRDASGRFAPRTPARDALPQDPQSKTPAAVAGQQSQQTSVSEGAQPAAVAPGPRAPVSWRPEEREGWDTMPAHHKAAIQRRELEMQQALSSTADARRVYGELQQVVGPYMHMIQAEGSTPMRAIAEVMQTAAALRSAPPGHKAQLVADMIMQFGVDPAMLDTALAARVSGQQMAPNPQDQLFRAIDQRLQPVTDFMNSFQQQRQNNEFQTQQQAMQTWQEFASDPANEYANDLSNEIGDLLELAARHGRVMSLQDAYRTATLAHPTISQLVQRKNLANGAQQQDAAARRALNAAASISSGNAPQGGNQEEESDGSVRGDLMASIRTLSARRQ